MNDTAPVFSFQISSSKVDSKIQKLDRKKVCQEKKNTTKVALSWLAFVNFKE